MAGRLLYPRPEYPRPDRQRGTLEGHDWLNLNGPWQFRFDPERRGLAERWFAAEAFETDWREQILVPFCWESLAAWGAGDSAGNDNYYSTRVFRNPLEVTRANHRSVPRYEVGWYRRAVEIPHYPAWQGKRVILTIGAADFFTDCWCNGHHLGHHEGGYTPFEFDLTDALENRGGQTRARLVLRVEDPMDNSEQPVGKQWRWYTTTSGIWQTVYVEPRSRTFIDSFRIVTDLAASAARFSIKCAQADEQCAVEVEISPPGAEVQRATLEVRQGQAEQTLRLATVRLWDPNTPHLYPVVLRLRRGEELLDTVNTYFGLRCIDFALAKESGVPASLRVNGVVRFLRGALYQSYFPDGVYTATSADTLRNDLAYAKKVGFNFLRVHIKVDDPLLLYWADQLGVLLMADFPNFGEGGDTPLGRRRFEAMVRETIVRDFNHPSIFAWCLFNETWGFGGQTSFADKLHPPSVQTPGPNPTTPNAPGQAPSPHTTGRSAAPKLSPSEPMPSAQAWVQSMWELAKQLDPTRLVEDMSVCHWEHLEYYLHGDTDINSWHFYINEYAKAKAHIDKVVNSTFVGCTFNYVPGFLHKGQPLINSEYGGIGALDGDRDISWSFKFLTNELRRHQQIAAYIYTELHDVEWEYNGFLNYDRTPKEFGYDPRIINESNTLPIDAPPVQRLAPGQNTRLEVASSHYSSSKYEHVSLHWKLGGIDTRGRLCQDLVRGSVPIAFPHRQVAHAHTIEMRLPEIPMLCTLLLAARSADGLTRAENFVHYFASNGYPPEREELSGTLVLRGVPGQWAQAQWSGAASSRESSLAEDSCYGFGHGFFEWVLPLRGADLAKARRLKVLCEASSHRADSPQTDADVYPTTLQIFLNDIQLYEAVIRDHPHDSQGVLSYLRGGVGAYGYLTQAFAEDELLRQVAAAANGSLRLRCAVPAEALVQGGLTIYGAECGRFPVSPTVIIDW
ncbi:Beta-galactosidase [Verrucomicrobia bacterium]|nr:Beta-galactosidase [Verrucomicrobiota bacterium]